MLEFEPISFVSGNWFAHAAYIAAWQDPTEDILQYLDVAMLRYDKDWSVKWDGEITIPESEILPAHITINGKYDHQSVNNSNSLFWLSSLFSILWHKVDYFSKAFIL